MHKVRFIKHHDLFAHSVGDEVTLLDKDAAYLLDSGHVVSLEETIKTATLPKGETATIKSKGKK